MYLCGTVAGSQTAYVCCICYGGSVSLFASCGCGLDGRGLPFDSMVGQDILSFLLILEKSCVVPGEFAVGQPHQHLCLSVVMQLETPHNPHSRGGGQLER